MGFDAKHYMIDVGTEDYAISFHFLNPKLRITCSKKFLSKGLLNMT